MSLVQHVSAVEGIDREREEDIDVQSLLQGSQAGRRLSLTISYDPIPDLILPATEKVDPVAPYEISAAKRIAQVTVGVLICMLSSGIVFGFAALKSVLVQEQIYRDLCTEDELRQDVPICYLQDQRLNLTFVVGSVTANLSALIVGATLDRFGPRVCGIISGVLLLVGTLFMAFAQDVTFDAILAGSFFLSLGGTFCFVPSFHLSNAFPQFQGLILALVTGAFDASAAVFLVFRLLYEATDEVFDLKRFFLLYLLVPILSVLAHLFLMPNRSYETRLELNIKLEAAEDPTADVHDSDDDLDNEAEIWRVRSERSVKRKRSLAEMRDLLGTPRQRDEYEKKEDEKRMTSGVWGALHGLPAHKQIQTPWFILITLLTVLQMARFNFFIATIWTQYEYMLDSARLATEVNEFFDILLPIGGVATVPFIGLLLDNTSTVVVLALLVLMSTAIGVLGAVPSIEAAYWNIILFCIFRPLYYSAMSDYAAKVFGFATFGTVYGTIICLSGVITFTQPALQALIHSAYENDPGPINLWLAGLGLIIGVTLVMYIDRKGREVRREQAEEDERRSLLPRNVSRRTSRGSLRDNNVGTLGADGERTPLLSGSLRHKTSKPLLTPVEEANEPSFHSSSDV